MRLLVRLNVYFALDFGGLLLLAQHPGQPSGARRHSLGTAAASRPSRVHSAMA